MIIVALILGAFRTGFSFLRLFTLAVDALSCFADVAAGLPAFDSGVA